MPTAYRCGRREVHPSAGWYWKRRAVSCVVCQLMTRAAVKKIDRLMRFTRASLACALVFAVRYGR